MTFTRFVPVIVLLSLCGCVTAPVNEDNIENTNLSFDDPSQAKPISADSFVGHALQMEGAIEQAENAFSFQPTKHETYRSAILASYTPRVKEVPGHVDGIKAMPKINVTASSLDVPSQPVVVGGEPAAIMVKPALAARKTVQVASHSRKLKPESASAPHNEEVASLSGLLKPGM